MRRRSGYRRRGADSDQAIIPFSRQLLLKLLEANIAGITTLSLSFATNRQPILLLRLLSAAGTGGIATIALTAIGDRYSNSSGAATIASPRPAFI